MKEREEEAKRTTSQMEAQMKQQIEANKSSEMMMQQQRSQTADSNANQESPSSTIGGVHELNAPRTYVDYCLWGVIFFSICLLIILVPIFITKL